MDHKERMLEGLPYKAHLGQLPEEQLANRVRVYQFNHCPPQDLQKVEEYTC
jgi:hypothetical protein